MKRRPDTLRSSSGGILRVVRRRPLPCGNYRRQVVRIPKGGGPDPLGFFFDAFAAARRGFEEREAWVQTPEARN